MSTEKKLLSISLVLLIGCLLVVVKLTLPSSEKDLAAGLTLEDLEPDATEVIVDTIGIPWEIVFISNDEMLVSMREGELLRVNLSGEILDRLSPEAVNASGTISGGSLGVALHPNFKENNQIYFYQTVQKNDAPSNRVARYTLAENKNLQDERIIIDNLPAALYHNGGRIKFGPDNHLYISTGDSDKPESAQNLSNLSGKILRLTDDGTVPEDNPFGNEIWSYGHRNPQGLAWDNAGNLWSTEHGNSAHDELNLIVPGNNYGWPTIIGMQSQEGLETPVIESGAHWTWAPSAIIYKDNNLFYAGLKGESLFQATLDGRTASNLQAHFQHEFGRIRVVTQGPDGDFYIATSNTDGQGFGIVRENDNKIIRIDQDVFTY